MGLKKIPSKVQLPGGVHLSAVPFRVTEYHDDGSPKTFEILPRGTEKAEFWLFADDVQIRSNLKGKLGDGT